MATGVAKAPTPGSRSAGLAIGFDVPEASNQTYLLGAPLSLDASGNVAEMASNGVAIFGFAQKAGQNNSTAGAATAKVFKYTPGDRFECTLSVPAWNQSLVGSKVAFAKVSSTWVLATATSISSIAQAVVLGVNSLWQAGDTNPVVIFSIVNNDVQGVI